MSASPSLDTAFAGNIQFRDVYKKRFYADGENSRMGHLNCVELKTFFHRQFSSTTASGQAVRKLLYLLRHAGCLRTVVILV